MHIFQQIQKAFEEGAKFVDVWKSNSNNVPDDIEIDSAIRRHSQLQVC